MGGGRRGEGQGESGGARDTKRELRWRVATSCRYSNSDSTADLCSTLTHHAALVPVASRDRSPLAVASLDAGVAVDHHQQAHRAGGRPSAHLVEEATVVVEVETGARQFTAHFTVARRNSHLAGTSAACRFRAYR